MSGHGPRFQSGTRTIPQPCLGCLVDPTHKEMGGTGLVGSGSGCGEAEGGAGLEQPPAMAHKGMDRPNSSWKQQELQ